MHLIWEYARIRQVLRSGDFRSITALPVEGYRLLQEIPVHLEQVDDEVWIARFEEANIGMSGNSPEDAMEALTFDIVDTLEFFLEEEERLIPKLKEHLNVLRQYVKVP